MLNVKRRSNEVQILFLFSRQQLFAANTQEQENKLFCSSISYVSISLLSVNHTRLYLFLYLTPLCCDLRPRWLITFLWAPPKRRTSGLVSEVLMVCTELRRCAAVLSRLGVGGGVVGHANTSRILDFDESPLPPPPRR